MTDEQTKQAILGFTEFFKDITGNQDIKIPNEIAEKYGIEEQTERIYGTDGQVDNTEYEYQEPDYEEIDRKIEEYHKKQEEYYKKVLEKMIQDKKHEIELLKQKIKAAE